jgi:hypothetical protein
LSATKLTAALYFSLAPSNAWSFAALRAADVLMSGDSSQLNPAQQQPQNQQQRQQLQQLHHQQQQRLQLNQQQHLNHQQQPQQLQQFQLLSQQLQQQQQQAQQQQMMYQRAGLPNADLARHLQQLRGLQQQVLGTKLNLLVISNYISGFKERAIRCR